MIGRLLVCGQCRAAVDVVEAAAGASGEEEHRFLDASTFVCGGCLEASGQARPLVTSEGSSRAVEAAGRARTAQETARWRDAAEREQTREGEH